MERVNEYFHMLGVGFGTSSLDKHRLDRAINKINEIVDWINDYEAKKEQQMSELVGILNDAGFPK